MQSVDKRMSRFFYSFLFLFNVIGAYILLQFSKDPAITSLDLLGGLIMVEVIGVYFSAIITIKAYKFE